jgi:hypothetical protein
MPWYERGQKKYYYRSERDANGRPRRRYVGTGAAAAARQAAAQDEQRRRARAAAAAAWQAELADLLALDALVARFYLISEGLLTLALTEAGYEKHRGHWRRRRGHTTNRSED